MVDLVARRICIAAVILIGTLVYQDTTSAAPPPNYAIRRTATFHIQLAVSDVTLPDMTPGMCRVSGTVASVFRAPASTLSEGDDIEVETECDIAGPDGDSGDLADADELQAADYVEMYLNPGSDAAYRMAGEQYMVIKAPTPEPLCETDKVGVTC